MYFVWCCIFILSKIGLDKIFHLPVSESVRLRAPSISGLGKKQNCVHVLYYFVITIILVDVCQSEMYRKAQKN